MTTQTNPLQGFYRNIKKYISLPSGTSYYEEGIVEFNEDGEVGIMPMTGNDEVTIRNPEALLNGAAITDVIKSCVPAIKHPEKLLINDIDVLLIAIRFVTHGESMDIKVECPNCNHENNYSINLEENLSRINKLEDEYPLNLQNGLTLMLQPLSFKYMLKALKAQFEQSKIVASLESATLTDEQRFNMFSNSFTHLSILNYELTAAAIRRIVKEDDGIDVTDFNQILDFLKNIDMLTFEHIEEASKKLSDVGIEKNFTAKCQNDKCKHEWPAPVDFNPVNFFTGS